MLSMELPTEFILLCLSYVQSGAPASCMEDTDTEESRDYIRDETVV